MRPSAAREISDGDHEPPVVLGSVVVQIGHHRIVGGEKLVRGQRWTLRCGSHDLDIEGRPPGVPRYQELLYEAVRFEPAPDVAVEVASPEDIEHYQHVSRTGVAPEFRLARNASIERG